MVNKTAILSLRTQFENLGDLLINSAAVGLLSRKYCVVLDVSRVPSWYKKLLLSDVVGIKTTNYLALQLIFAKPESKLFLKPGGYPGIAGFKLALRRLLHTAFLFTVRLRGLKIVRLSSSQGFSTKWAFVESLRVRQIDTCCIRDAASRLEINRLGGNAYACPDFSLFYFNENSKFSTKIEDIDFASKESIAFSFRGDRAGLCKIDRISELVDFCGSDLSLSIVSQVNFDDEFNYMLSLEKGAKYACYRNDEKSISEIKEIYKRSKFVVSDRLHVLLMGALNGAIPVAFISAEKDSKVAGCLEELGIKNIIYYDKGGFDFSALDLSYFTVMKSLEGAKKEMLAMVNERI